MNKGVISAVAGIAMLGTAQVQGADLPLNLALESAQAAMAACQRDGYKVTVAVVDFHGETKVLLKADGSTIHTKDTAYRKAYTLVTLGPIFDLNTSSEAQALLSGKPSEPGFLTIPNVAPLPGAVAIRKGGELIGAVGVGGAPGGAKDEACAKQGVDAIQAKLKP